MSILDNLKERAAKFIDALGGKSNVTQIEACITRLRLEIEDHSKIDKQKLEELGAKANIAVGENGLQVVLGKDAQELAEQMKDIKE